MGVVTVEDESPFALLPKSDDWTVDDLERLPDDGLRYELFDGVLVVSPAPRVAHQRAVLAIYRLLYAACPPELEVFVAPLDFQPTHKRSFQPDVLVVRRADVSETTPLQKPLVLAVEVLSDSTRSRDQIFKRAMYASSGVPLFWIFDPKVPRLHVFELQGQEYVEVTTATGAERVALDAPFPVTVCPSQIAAG
jgi:Uma2 family endonuclease